MCPMGLIIHQVKQFSHRSKYQRVSNFIVVADVLGKTINTEAQGLNK